MPIYEFYCPENHTIYQFYAKTQAQAARIPRCPDNPRFTLRKVLSRFAVNTGAAEPASGADTPAGEASPEDVRMDAAMASMEREFSSVDENDPRAMGRMMRRMAELSGEKIDGEMEEVVRKLEEGTDPEALEEQLGGGGPPGGAADPDGDDGPPFDDRAVPAHEPKTPRMKYRAPRPAPRRDPQLYDYD
jgi:hypothetical protein